MLQIAYRKHHVELLQWLNDPATNEEILKIINSKLISPYLPQAWIETNTPIDIRPIPSSRFSIILPRSECGRYYNRVYPKNYIVWDEKGDLHIVRTKEEFDSTYQIIN